MAPRTRPTRRASKSLFDDRTIKSNSFLRDEGTPFDPLSLPPPNLSDDIEERGVGDIGIFLIKEMMDELEYRHKDGWNCLRLAKQVGAG